MRTFVWFLVVGLLLTTSTAPAVEPTSVLQVVDMEGHDLDLDATIAAGRNVVLVFWQTWCGPCRREAPRLAEAATSHAEGLQFVGVVAGAEDDVDDEKVRAYVEKYHLPYPQVRDLDLSLTRLYEVVGTPTIIILGPGREVLYRGNHPPEDWAVFDGHPSHRG